MCNIYVVEHNIDAIPYKQRGILLYQHSNSSQPHAFNRQKSNLGPHEYGIIVPTVGSLVKRRCRILGVYPFHTLNSQLWRSRDYLGRWGRNTEKINKRIKKRRIRCRKGIIRTKERRD